MRFILPAVILFLASCSSEIKKPAAPDDLVSRDTMVLIMRKLVVLEAHIESNYPNVQNYHELARKTGNKVLKDLHVSPDRFERSYAYYVGHQDELQGIYTEVLDSLNKEVHKLSAKGIKSTEAQEGPSVVRPFDQ